MTKHCKIVCANDSCNWNWHWLHFRLLLQYNASVKLPTWLHILDTMAKRMKLTQNAVLCDMTHSDWQNVWSKYKQQKFYWDFVWLFYFCSDNKHTKHEWHSRSVVLLNWSQRQWIYWVNGIVCVCVCFRMLSYRVLFGLTGQHEQFIALEWRSAVWIQDRFMCLTRHKTFATPLWCSIWVVCSISLSLFSLTLGVVVICRALCECGQYNFP